MYNECTLDDFIYTIKKGTLVTEIPMLAGLGDIAKKGGCYAALNINADGSIMLNCSIPHVHRDEINDFEYRTLSFYSYPVEGELSALLVRGAFSMDIILDGNIYPDDRIERMICPNNSLVHMYQSDTMSGKITAIRTVYFPDELRLKLQQMIKSNMNYTTRDIQNSYPKHIFKMTPNQLEEASTYMGKAIDVTIPKSIEVAPFGYDIPENVDNVFIVNLKE